MSEAVRRIFLLLQLLVVRASHEVNGIKTSGVCIRVTSASFTVSVTEQYGAAVVKLHLLGPFHTALMWLILLQHSLCITDADHRGETEGLVLLCWKMSKNQMNIEFNVTETGHKIEDESLSIIATCLLVGDCWVSLILLSWFTTRWLKLWESHD